MQANHAPMHTCDASSKMQTKSRFTSHPHSALTERVDVDTWLVHRMSHQFVIQRQKLYYVIERLLQ